jgi:putative ABC transport system permease protein
MAEVLANEYAEVQKSTRLIRLSGNLRVRYDDHVFYEPRVLAADSNFFDLFSIKLIHGNPKEVLVQPNTVVLTESMARKYFGDEDAIGKQLFLFSDTSSYMVTGITEDVPSNCHFNFDLLLSFTTFPLSKSTSWAGYNVYTYVVLDRPESARVLEEKLPALVEQYFGPEVETILGKRYEEYVAAGNFHNYHLQHVSDIHLMSNYQNELLPNGDIRYVYLFEIVCLFILLVAGVNFTNLSTARSLRRAKEIGVRKVNGSSKRHIIFQFLSESLFTTSIATFIAIGLVILLIGKFNELAGKDISLLNLNIFWVALVVIVLILMNGILAGIYPALVISQLNPINIFKGKLKAGKQRYHFRNGLIVFQFGVSVILIISTLVIFRQLQFMRDRKLGFDKDQIIVIERANLLAVQRNAFNEEIRQIPGVRTVGGGSAIPGRQFGGATFQAIGAEATERINHSASFNDVYFPDALGLEILAGRTYAKDIASDSIAVIVNEALIKRVGWKSAHEAIGEKIRPVFDRQNQYEIIGVVRDFNFESLRSSIQPLAMYGNSNDDFNPLLSVIRIQAGINVNDLTKRIEKIWTRFLPDEQIEFKFLNDEFNQLYGQEERFGSIFSLFSGLAIFIACIGVIGLSTFMAAERTKEIGIRKVVGASLSSLLYLLSKDFLKLVLLANLIFWPVAWYGLNEWLSNYPFRTELSLVDFLITGLVTSILVLISVLWQSLNASLVNPVKSLRSE